VAGDGPEDAGDHPARGGGEVHVAGLDGAHLRPAGLHGVDEGLEVAERPVEAVGVVGVDGADPAVPEVPQQSVPCRASPGTEGAHVVVDVLAERLVAVLGGQAAAVLELAGDAFAVAAIERDAGVHGCRRHDGGN